MFSFIDFFRNKYYAIVGSENNKFSIGRQIKVKDDPELWNNHYEHVINILLFAVLLVIPIGIYTNILTGLGDYNDWLECVSLKFTIITILLFLLLFYSNTFIYNFDDKQKGISDIYSSISFRGIFVPLLYFSYSIYILYPNKGTTIDIATIYDMVSIILFAGAIPFFLKLRPYKIEVVDELQLVATLCAIGIIASILHYLGIIAEQRTIVIILIFYFYILTIVILLLVKAFYRQLYKTAEYGIIGNTITQDHTYSDSEDSRNSAGF